MKIGLYRGKSFVSRRIKKRTRSIYSHAALHLDDGTVIEAWADNMVSGKVYHRPVGEGHTVGTPVDLFEIIDTVDWKAVEEFALDQVGKPYDWRMVWGFVTHRRKATKGSQDKWFCSELVFKALQVGGFNLFRITEPFEVSPGLLGRSIDLKPCGTIITT
jgi:uncharacterized protein YycO